MSVPAQQTLLPLRSPSRLARFPRARPLVGRAKDLHRLVSLILEPGGVVTVLGAPGIGKTSLATVAAERVSASVKGWFCDLAHQHDEGGLYRQLADVLGEPSPTRDGLAEALASLGPGLVVLDNFEQLVGHAPTLAEWSLVAPEVTFMVTSRERLAIDGERVVELAPLALPDEDGAAEAVALFEARAREAGAPVDAADADAVAEIVRHLDGVPLAIELAAARLRVLSPRALLDRLRDGADVLTLHKRAPERHRTLFDAIAWSWKLLDDDEQIALACCSLFAGRFTVEAAERVVGAGLDEGALDRIAALRDKSLLHRTEDGRLGLLLSIRQFAAKALLRMPPTIYAAAAQEHARLFAELATTFTRSRLLLGATTAGDVHREADNLESALEHLQALVPHADRDRWLAEVASAVAFVGFARPERVDRALVDVLTRMDDQEELAVVVRMARQQCWLQRGEPDEGLVIAAAVADDVGLPPRLRAAALLRIGIHERELGRQATALRAHEQVEEMLAGQKPSRLGAVNLACRGRLACDRGAAEEARRLNEDAARACEALNEQWLAALAPANVAQLEQALGRFERAEHLLERAISRFRRDGEPFYEGFYATICGGLYLEWGKRDLARHWYEASVRPVEAYSRAFAALLLHGGWAVLEAFDGHGEAALGRLENARRAAQRCPGELARLIAGVQANTVEVALGLTAPEGLRPLEEGAAAILDGNLDGGFARRLLARAVASAAPRAPRLTIERDGRSFVWSGQEPVDLSRRGAPRRILEALRAEHPEGRALPTDEVFAAGWPGQRIQPESAATRVRVAIATLRKLGLRPVLQTSDEGYRLDPEVEIL